MQVAKYSLLTKAGMIESFVEEDSDKEPEELVEELRIKLNVRPQWMTLGEVVFFSGAVSAIGVDTYDREEDDDE